VGHATQPESTVSVMAICQRRSLCVSHTRRGPHGVEVTRATWMHVGWVLNDHAQTCAAAAAA